MLQLDERFLVSLGLGSMPAEEKETFLAYLYKEFQSRVGDELSRDLSDEQLEQFEKLVDSGDKEKSQAWLEKHCPNYRDVVAAELEKLRQEIIANRDKLLGSD